MINRIGSVEAPGNGRRRVVIADPPPRPSDGASRDDWRERVEQYVGDHPVLSLAVGFTLGIVIGCVIKRR